MRDEGLAIYLEQLRQYPVLTAEEEQNLAQRAAAGDKRARQTLIECNLRLVVSIAKKYHSKEHTLMDLIQEGNVGLMEGIDRYDYTKGYKLSTYTTWHIRKRILLAIDNQEPELQSLDAEISASEDGTNITLRDIIPAEGLAMEDAIAEDDMYEKIKNEMAQLDTLERQVLDMRYGNEPKTLAAIGEVFGCTRQNIYDIEQKAINKIRRRIQI